MLLMDKEIDELYSELSKIIMPEPLERLKTILGRLYEKLKQLTVSRDLWRDKFKELSDKEKPRPQN